MKTINTILSIYDSLEKRDRNRTGSQMPILTPRYRLPAFQWKDDTDGAATVNAIEFLNESNEIVHPYFGLTGWTPDSSHWSNFQTNRLDIISATANSGFAVAYITPAPITVRSGDVINISLNLNISAGGIAKLNVSEAGSDDWHDLVSGINIFSHTVTVTGDLSIYLHPTYGTLPVTLSMTDVAIWKLTYTDYFTSLPSSHSVGSDLYFQYKGDTLKYFLLRGTFCLKITMNNGCIYYSDQFVVSDVYENLINHLKRTNGYPHGAYFSGISVLHAHNSTSVAINDIDSNVFNVKKGESIKCILFYILTSGQSATVSLFNSTTVVSNTVTLSAGINDITLTATVTGSVSLRFSNTANTEWETLDILAIRSYSPDFIKIAFNDTHDLGDILYHDGFINTCFLEAKLNNPSHEVVEVGEEKNGIFITEKLVTKYKYKIIANVSRQLYTALMRLPQHDTITITDEVGNIYTPKVGNIWVSAPNWIFYDICRIEIQFNDNSEFVWTSENNNLT